MLPAVAEGANLDVASANELYLVKKMIEQEDKSDPLTDDQIARILCGQGINVNRRTVAKYRADMKIPSTHQRRTKH